MEQQAFEVRLDIPDNLRVATYANYAAACVASATAGAASSSEWSAPRWAS